eukprot:3658346-Ditylum_brightwellii.AAC.1
MDTYDTSQLVQGEEDQRHLDSLPEFEREAILAERFEKLKNAQDMKRALRENKRKEREQRKQQKNQQQPKPKPQSDSESEKEDAKSDKSSQHSDASHSSSEEEHDPTSNDAEMAAALANSRLSTRNKDATGKKASKNQALASFRED